MKVMTASEYYEPHDKDIFVFLAGDVTYRTALRPSMIYKDQDDKTIIFWAND